MLTRAALSRGAHLAVRRQTQQRCYAAAAAATTASTGSATFETSEAGDVKIAARDTPGRTTKLAVVAKAGTRYQPAPGLTIGLEEFAFKNTLKRSGLRIVREAELLGGQLSSYHTREALVLEARFLSEDIPYFTELLAEVITQSKYTTFEFHEDIERVFHIKQARIQHDASSVALDAVHAAAFHTGLGSPLYPTSSTPLHGYLNEHNIAAFSSSAYAKPNIALVADGTSTATLSKWTTQFFKHTSQPPATKSASIPSTSIDRTPSKYYGGEQRISHTHGNAMVIALPGSSFGSFKPEIAVLAALLGGQPNVKYQTGFSLLSKAVTATNPFGVTASASNFGYSDAGLLAMQISGSAKAVRETAQAAVQALRGMADNVSEEDLIKAVAKAKFDAYTASESSATSLLSTGSGIVHTGSPFKLADMAKSIEGVTPDRLKAAAKEILGAKASLAAVGDLHVLPYGEELGLKV